MGAVKRTHPTAVRYDKCFRMLRKCHYQPTRRDLIRCNKIKRLYPNTIAPEKLRKEHAKKMNRFAKSVVIWVTGAERFQEAILKAGSEINRLGKAIMEPRN